MKLQSLSAYEEDVLMTIFKLRETNQIPTLKSYLLQVDASKIGEALESVYTIEMWLNFGHTSSKYKSLIAELNSLKEAASEEEFSNRNDKLRHVIERAMDTKYEAVLTTYLKVLLIEYAVKLKLDIELLATINTSHVSFKNPDLESYIRCIDQYHEGRSFINNQDYLGGLYTLKDLVRKLLINSDTTYQNLLSYTSLNIMISMLNASDTIHYHLYQELIESHSSSVLILEQLSLLQILRDYYENKPCYPHVDFWYENCKLSNNILTDLYGKRLDEYLVDISNMDFENMDMFNYEEHTLYAAALLLHGKEEEAELLYEKMYNAIDVSLLEEEPGYKLKMLSEYYKYLLIKCENKKLSACEKALEVIKKAESLMNTDEGSKDMNHYSSFISEYGLAELNILYLQGNHDNQKIAELYYKTKNRFLNRNLFQNSDNSLEINEKEKLTQLKYEMMEISVKLHQQSGQEALTSHWHHHIRTKYEEISKLEAKTNDLLAITPYHWQDMMKVSQSLKGNLYVDFLHDRDYLYIYSVLDGMSQLMRKPYDEQAIEKFSQMVEDRHSSIDSIQMIGAAVFELLFGHLDLSHVSSLTICPSGILEYVPFGAMYIKSLNCNLHEVLPISFIPNVAYYKRGVMDTIKSVTFLPYTKSVSSSSSNAYPPLFFVSNEISMLRKKNGLTLKVLDNQNLNKKQILQSMNSDVVHFSTHAISNNSHKYGSYIVYYTGKDEKIYGYDIQAQRLNTKLVVLNACNTNKGASFEGEGLFSLTYSFLSAGVHNIVTTTQSINDQSSAEIMDYFYEDLMQSKSVAKAMQKAQCQMSNVSPYEHPYYWAGYRVYGEVNQ